MAAARYSSDVLQMFYGPIPMRVKENQREPLESQKVPVFGWFQTCQYNNPDLNTWRMDVSERNPYKKDMLMFARENKEKFTNLAEQEVQRLKSAKVSFALEVKFSRERDGKTQDMKHFFRDKNNQPFLFMTPDKAQIEQKLDEFIENTKGEIEHWSERVSGWEVERITIAYVDVEIYHPIPGGTYLPLPAWLANKKAIINMKNRDKEFLRWALRAALFPPKDGKDPQRTSKYPVNDSINYEGIDFPTPIKQIDKLEAQNKNLTITIFGCENKNLFPLKVSGRREEKNVRQVNLILIESGEVQHYCCVKRVSALLFDKSLNNKTHYCLMCLSHFTKANLLEDHKKYRNGVNGRPTTIEMPEEGKNTLSFQNHHKQMKMPYVIYADFEALVRKILGCERRPEREQKSYTEKTERHEACWYSYMVARSDGEVSGSKVYRGENAVGMFLSDILQEEEKIRESLTAPKPIVMAGKDWEKFRKATDCHICNKSLIKDEFLDSLPVWNIEEAGEEGSEKCSYWGQGYKKCFYMAQKEQKCGVQRLKRLADKKDQLEAKSQ